jgi:tetratricopeptide (TPR) repeat protein
VDKINSIFFLFLIILFCFFSSAFPLSNDHSFLLQQGIETLDQAYKDWDEKLFIQSLYFFEKAARSRPEDGLAEYWSGSAYFFLAVQDLFSQNKRTDRKQGTENIKKGIRILDRAIELRPDFCENYALRGVLRGMLIKLKPLGAFLQGPKVGKDRKKALKLDPNNPRVHYLTGVSFWFAPEILGGKEKALEHLLKAEKLFEREKDKNKDPLLPEWGHSTCLSFIGDFYLSEKKADKAEQYYAKALAVNPEDPLAIKGINQLKAMKKD